MKLLPELENLLDIIAKLPGIGRRSAERIAIDLITNKNDVFGDLINALEKAKNNITCCSKCGAITLRTEDPCKLCTDSSRDDTVLCIVENPADILLIEQAGVYNGRYYCIMGKISPMSNTGISDLQLSKLERRLENKRLKEIILALNNDVESEATAQFLYDKISGHNIKISRPAMGLPAGSGISYADQITLGQAFKSRLRLQ
jgi:recombination protein RecR